MNSVEKLGQTGLGKLDLSTKTMLMPYQVEALARANEIKTVIEHLKNPVSQVQRVNGLIRSLKNATKEQASLILKQLQDLHSPLVDVPTLTNDVTQFFASTRQPQDLREFSQFLHAQQIKVRANKADLRNILIRKAVSSAQWADRLKYVQVTVKPTAGDVVGTKAIGLVQSLIPYNMVAKSYANSIFTFIGQGCHIDGTVHRVMAAYTKKHPLPKPDQEVYVPEVSVLDIWDML